MLRKVRNQAKRLKTFLLVSAMLALPNIVFASATGLGGGTARSWPWTRFLLSIVRELTGPLPTALGALGIVGAAFALLSGRAEPNKFILIIFAVSIAMTAPTLITWMTGDASGITIGGW